MIARKKAYENVTAQRTVHVVVVAKKWHGADSFLLF